MNYQDYLNEHTINDESIKKFGLSGDEKKLNIPVKDRNGNLLFIKERRFEGDKKFYIPEGTQTVLFNSQILQPLPKYIIITAGEIDCIRLNQEGLKAISSTAGEGTFKSEWADQLRGISLIYTCLDNDKAGKDGTEKIASLLPAVKCIQLPAGVKDICEFFSHHTKDDFIGLIKQAYQFKKETKESSILKDDNQPVLLSDLKTENLKKNWIWEGYIAKGFITLLTAPPKTGKSEFIRSLLKALEEEEEFIGQPTTKVNVLVISEESTTDWVEKRDEFGLGDDLKVWIWSKPFLTKIKLKIWEVFFTEVLEFCKENKIELIIMDTISKNWPVDNENDATQMDDALRPTYIWAKNNLAVLLIHHDNKHGGDFGKNIRGSSAIAGFADMLISYQRLEGANYADRKRVLRTSGRFSNAEDDLVIEWQDDLTYKYIGSPYSVSKSGRLEVILGIFENNTEAICVRDIARQWDDSRFGKCLSLRTIQRYVTELFDKNILALIKTEIVVRSPVPYYALKDGYKKQLILNERQPSPPVSSVSRFNGLSHNKASHDSDDSGKEDILSRITPYHEND